MLSKGWHSCYIHLLEKQNPEVCHSLRGKLHALIPVLSVWLYTVYALLIGVFYIVVILYGFATGWLESNNQMDFVTFKGCACYEEFKKLCKHNLY